MQRFGPAMTAFLLLLHPGKKTASGALPASLTGQ
jgi:hypothetical protein